MLKDLWRSFDVGWQTLRFMRSVSMSYGSIYYDAFCNIAVFHMFIRKWKVYYYNRVLYKFLSIFLLFRKTSNKSTITINL